MSIWLTNKKAEQASSCHVKRCSPHLYKFYKHRQDAEAKLSVDIRNWATDDFLARELGKDNVFYKASNVICGPTCAGKTMFTSWFLLNLLNAHKEKRFLIFIFAKTGEAYNKLSDMQDILMPKEKRVDFNKQHVKGRSLAIWTSELEQILNAYKTIELYYDTIMELTGPGQDQDSSTLGRRVLEKLQQHDQSNFELIKLLVEYTDYIFYFDDCLDTVLNPKSDAVKSFLAKLQTTNRHFFITTIYSLQNIKVRDPVFCSNLTNMFVIGALSETDQGTFDKYSTLLKSRFQGPSGLTLYNAGLRRIFGEPQYTAQLFSQRFPGIVYWGILPKSYINKLQQCDAQRTGLKRRANTAVFDHLNKRQRQQDAKLEVVGEAGDPATAVPF